MSAGGAAGAGDAPATKRSKHGADAFSAFSNQSRGDSKDRSGHDSHADAPLSPNGHGRPLTRDTCANILTCVAMRFPSVAPMVAETLGLGQLLEELAAQRDVEAVTRVLEEAAALNYVLQRVLADAHRRHPFFVRLLGRPGFAYKLALCLKAEDLWHMRSWLQPMQGAPRLPLSTVASLLEALSTAFSFDALAEHLRCLRSLAGAAHEPQDLRQLLSQMHRMACRQADWRWFFVDTLGPLFFTAHLENSRGDPGMRMACAHFMQAAVADPRAGPALVSATNFAVLSDAMLAESSQGLAPKVLTLLVSLVRAAPLSEEDVRNLVRPHLLTLPSLASNREEVVKLFTELHERGHARSLDRCVAPNDWLRFLLSAREVDTRVQILNFLSSLSRSTFSNFSAMMETLMRVGYMLPHRSLALRAALVGFFRHLASGSDDRKNMVFQCVLSYLFPLRDVLQPPITKPGQYTHAGVVREVLAFFKCLTSVEGPRKTQIFNAIDPRCVTALLFDSSDVQVQEQAAGFLRNLTHGDNNRKQTIFQSLPGSLMPLLSSPSPRVVQSVAGLLQNLCTRSEARRASVFEQLDLSTIVGLLRHSDAQVQAPAAGLLMNLCRSDHRRKLAILKAVPLNLVHTFYASGQPPRACREQVNGLVQHLGAAFTSLLSEGLILHEPGQPCVPLPATSGGGVGGAAAVGGGAGGAGGHAAGQPRQFGPPPVLHQLRQGPHPGHGGPAGQLHRRVARNHHHLRNLNARQRMLRHMRRRHQAAQQQQQQQQQHHQLQVQQAQQTQAQAQTQQQQQQQRQQQQRQPQQQTQQQQQQQQVQGMHGMPGMPGQTQQPPGQQ